MTDWSRDNRFDMCRMTDWTHSPEASNERSPPVRRRARGLDARNAVQRLCAAAGENSSPGNPPRQLRRKLIQPQRWCRVLKLWATSTARSSPSNTVSREPRSSGFPIWLTNWCSSSRTSSSLTALMWRRIRRKRRLRSLSLRWLATTPCKAGWCKRQPARWKHHRHHADLRRAGRQDARASQGGGAEDFARRRVVESRSCPPEFRATQRAAATLACGCNHSKCAEPSISMALSTQQLWCAPRVCSSSRPACCFSSGGRSSSSAPRTGLSWSAIGATGQRTDFCSPAAQILMTRCDGSRPASIRFSRARA